MTMIKTAKDWYDQKRIDYLRYTNREWEFIPWDHWQVQETLMRIGIEKKFFGLTTFDEDVLIANCVIMRDSIQRKQPPHPHSTPEYAEWMAKVWKANHDRNKMQ